MVPVSQASQPAWVRSASSNVLSMSMSMRVARALTSCPAGPAGVVEALAVAVDHGAGVGNGDLAVFGG